MKKIFLTYSAIFVLLLVSFLGIHLVTKAATSTSLHNVTVIDDATGQSTSIQTNATNVDTQEEIILRKSSNKTTINIGERVTYTVSVTIQDPLAPPPDPDPLTGTVSATGDIVYPIMDLTDNFPENFLRLENVTPSTGVTCQPDATEIRCQISDARVGDTFVVTSEFTALAQGTASNIATINDRNGTSNSVVSNVIILDPGNVFLIASSPDKNTIEIGEEVTYTTEITNRTTSETLTDINITDNYPESFLEIVSVTSSDNLTCHDDATEIRCNIQSLPPGESVTITTVYKALQAGTAANILSLSSNQSENAEFVSSITITEPQVQSLLLSSNCEGKNVFIGDRCALRAIAVYNFVEEKDVSDQVVWNGHQGIGNMLENVLTATAQGEAGITAIFEGAISNAILITVTDGVDTGRDLDGNIISHFHVRTRGGRDIIAAYNDPITIGVVEADNTAVARNNKITFTDMGVVEILDWFLEDSSFGTIRDASTNGECSSLENGIICRGKKAVTFEAGDKVGSVLLRVSDDDGNSRNLTLHILPPSFEKISIETVNGQPIVGTMDFSLQDTLSFTASGFLIDESTQNNIEGELEWEFNYNGEGWTQSSDAGTISRGRLQPLLPGTFAIRAKKVQHLALPGVNFLTHRDEEILSPEVSIQIGDPVAFVESLRLAGNEGMAKGTSDILFVRIRHFGTLADIGDMELNLIRGVYNSAKDIPDTAQHFSIHLVEEDIYREADDKNTVLLQIPFHIPLLDDITAGGHTLQLVINNKNGLLKDSVEAVLPVYIGDPLAGDATLDGEINIVDAVVALRIAEGNIVPNGLRIVALDADQDNTVTFQDFLEIFQKFLSTFLK